MIFIVKNVTYYAIITKGLNIYIDFRNHFIGSHTYHCKKVLCAWNSIVSEVLKLEKEILFYIIKAIQMYEDFINLSSLCGGVLEARHQLLLVTVLSKLMRIHTKEFYE